MLIVRKLCSLLLLIFLTAGLSGAQDTHKTFIAIGGGYADTLGGMVAEALQRTSGQSANIVVLPTAFSSNASSITDDERKINLVDAEVRRAEIEAACIAAIPAGKKCTITLAPIFTHDDALDGNNLSLFTGDIAAVYMLGGDQTVAMQAIAGTPLEDALAAAYQRGTLIVGTSAGLNMQSRTMIAGYAGDFDLKNSLNQGAVEVWDASQKRGLSFGIADVTLDSHFWEQGRLPRLLNALAQPGLPHVGIGVDTYSAVTITDATAVANVFGLYGAVVLDAETYSAAVNAAARQNVLSIHNVLFHLLAPGDFSYDLATRQMSLAPVPKKLIRASVEVKLPDDAGGLILAGNLAADLAGGKAVLDRFLELSGGATATIVVVAVGYTSQDDAAAAITAYGKALATKTIGLILGADSTAEIPPAATEYGGIVLIAPDQASIQPDLLLPLADAWRSGKTLLLDNAAAAIAGSYYVAQGATPKANDKQPTIDQETIQGAFLQDHTPIQSGWGILPLLVEPRLLADTRWGRWVALAYHHPDTLAVGIPDNAALEISANGAKVLGGNGILTLDLRGAALDVGTNGAYVVANGLLDVFAPGETLAFVAAPK